MSFGIGTILGAVAGPLIGGLFGRAEGESNRDATAEANAANRLAAQEMNERNIAFQERTNAENRAAVDFWNAHNAGLTREMWERNVAMQKEFAQSGINWRVADARSAGLHPLYGLGGGGAAFSPVSAIVPGEAYRATSPRAEATSTSVAPQSRWMSDMGQDLSRAITAYLSPMARAQQELALKQQEAAIAKDQAIAGYYASRAAGVSQAGAASAPSPLPFAEPLALPYAAVEMPKGVQLGSPDADYPGKYGVVEPKGATVESVDYDAPYRLAGPARGGWQEYRLSRNMVALMPVNDEGWTEGFESMPKAMIPLWLKVNSDHYGPDFWRVAVQELGGGTGIANWASRLGYTRPEDRAYRFMQYPSVRRGANRRGVMPRY